MKELTPEQIQHNWGNLRQIIDTNFSGERLEKLNEMYDYFEERMMLAPASGKEHYHNCHVGGYVEHILHITLFSLQIKEMWEKNGATIDFTEEELVFSALHHDLGKVGDLAEDYYTHNDNLNYMTVTDRALWLLQHFGIKMTEKEYIGLRLTDGMYEEANKSYYVSYSPGRSLKTNIAFILHQADMMATKIEFDEWKRGYTVKVEEKKEVVEKKTEQSKKANQAFKELFGE